MRPIDSESNNPVPAAPPEPTSEPTPVYVPRRILQEPAPEFVPHMLAQLEDDLARSRKREAFWISIIVHIVLVLLIIFLPQFLPDWAKPHLLRAEELNQKEPTYLALPKDAQKPPANVHSNTLSDKNRIAQTPRPRLDRKTLQALRGNMMPPGLPGPPRLPQAAPSQPAPPARPAPQPPQESAAIPPSALKPLPATKPEPQLHPEPRTPRAAEPTAPSSNPFRASGSAGDAIAAASRYGHTPRFPASGGAGGSGYGMGPVDRNASFGPVDVLSDTQGVDFGPYLSRVLQTIKFNWYNLVPEEARPPLMKHGRVKIRFLISPNGKVQGLSIDTPSGDVPLDRAAYGGITASDPFSPLPHEFHGPYLALRITFIYNPTLEELQQLEGPH